MTLFTKQYKLTRKMLFDAKSIRFTLHDNKISYVLKDRDNQYEDLKKLSYFDFPIEFFQEKEALIDFSTTEDKDTGKVSSIECIINGSIFRHYVLGSDEWAPKTFQEEMIEKEIKRKNMERSSETIETKSEMTEGSRVGD